MPPKLPMPRGRERRVRSSALHILDSAGTASRASPAGTTFAGAGLLPAVKAPGTGPSCGVPDHPSGFNLGFRRRGVGPVAQLG